MEKRARNRMYSQAVELRLGDARRSRGVNGGSKTDVVKTIPPVTPGLP